MGVCASSQNINTRRSSGGGGGGGGRSATMMDDASSSSRCSKLIHVDGRVQELKQPIQAKHIVSNNPNCILCSSDSMSVGVCVPFVPDEEFLQPGQIYFLLPRFQAKQPLSLPDLCALAIKASSALSNRTVDLSSINSKFNLR